MKTLVIETRNDEDLLLLTSLAERLNLENKIFSSEENYSAPGKPLTISELKKLIVKAEKEKGISTKEFKSKISKW
ncbi:MAG: hypothetical protein WCO28_00270 [Bacteroidota bacterium]